MCDKNNVMQQTTFRLRFLAGIGNFMRRNFDLMNECNKRTIKMNKKIQLKLSIFETTPYILKDRNSTSFNSTKNRRTL